MKIFFIVCALASIIKASAQTTFNKRLKNIDSIITPYAIGWGSNCIYNNNKTFTINSCIDSSGWIGAYVSLLELNDTGKTINSIVFKKDSARYSIFNQSANNIIKTLNGGFAFIISSDSKYIINGTAITNIYLVVCDKIGDTIFTKTNRVTSINSDSVVQLPRFITQLPDSSFIIFGAIGYIYQNYDSTFLMRLDKNGKLIWDTVIYTSLEKNYPMGLWYQDGKIKVSVMGTWYTDHDVAMDLNHIYEFDTSGQMLKHHTLSYKSMAGGKCYTKYNEQYSMYFGVGDTLMNYTATSQNNNLNQFQYCTNVLGFLDNQYRLKWRYIMPMDTIYLPTIYPNRWVLASGSIRLHDGTIIWYGCRGSMQYGSTNKYIVGNWLLKTDSLGNRIWDRIFYDKEATNTGAPMYTSGACEADNGDIIFTGCVFGSPQYAITMRVNSNGMFNSTDSGFVGTDIYGNYPYVSLLQTFDYPDAIIEVGQLGKYELKVFPNPATNNLYVMFNIHEAGTLCIYDMQGKVVFTKQVTTLQNQTEIDISALPKGVYITECSTVKNRMVCKWMKE
jgi:hypothetical protein